MQRLAHYPPFLDPLTGPYPKRGFPLPHSAVVEASYSKYLFQTLIYFFTLTWLTLVVAL